MSLLWKILLPVALLLPVAAFAAGILATTEGDQQPVRETIVLDEVAAEGDGPADRDRGTKGAQGEDERPEGRKDDDGEDHSGPGGGGSDDDGEDDDGDDIDVVTVEPDDYTDDGGRDGGDDDRGDDD